MLGAFRLTGNVQSLTPLYLYINELSYTVLYITYALILALFYTSDFDLVSQASVTKKKTS